MSADKIKSEFKTAPKGVSHILGTALRDTGFSISDDEVRAETERLLKGGEVKSGASRAISNWLKYGFG